MPLSVVVWMSALALEAMRAEADARSPLETGGVLVGYSGSDREEFVVSDAIGPGPRARHKRWRFSPDAVFHQEEVARLYEESGRTCSYLGDWHSHPGGGARLSFLDKLTLTRIALSRPARAPVPLMALLHGKSPWALTVWVRRSGRIVEGTVRAMTD